MVHNVHDIRRIFSTGSADGRVNVVVKFSLYRKNPFPYFISSSGWENDIP